MIKKIKYYLFFEQVYSPELSAGSIRLIRMSAAVMVVLGVIFLLYMAFPVSDLLEGLGFIFGREKGIPLGKKLKLSSLYQAGN